MLGRFRLVSRLERSLVVEHEEDRDRALEAAAYQMCLNKSESIITMLVSISAGRRNVHLTITTPAIRSKNLNPLWKLSCEDQLNQQHLISLQEVLQYSFIQKSPGFLIVRLKKIVFRCGARITT